MLKKQPCKNDNIFRELIKKGIMNFFLVGGGGLGGLARLGEIMGWG